MEKLTYHSFLFRLWLVRQNSHLTWRASLEINLSFFPIQAVVSQAKQSSDMAGILGKPPYWAGATFLQPGRFNQFSPTISPEYRAYAN